MQLEKNDPEMVWDSYPTAMIIAANSTSSRTQIILLPPGILMPLYFILPCSKVWVSPVHLID